MFIRKFLLLLIISISFLGCSKIDNSPDFEKRAEAIEKTLDNLKCEKSILLAGSSEGSERTIYYDNDKNIVLIKLISYGSMGNKERNYYHFKEATLALFKTNQYDQPITAEGESKIISTEEEKYLFKDNEIINLKTSQKLDSESETSEREFLTYIIEEEGDIE